MNCGRCRMERNPNAGWWGSVYTKDNPNLILCPRCYREWQNSFKA